MHMSNRIIAHAKAEHFFTRSILHDLMVELCMRKDDPLAAVDERAKRKLTALDEVGATLEDQLFNQLALHEMETFWEGVRRDVRSEEHTSELQSLMRISYAVFCLKKK